jgi:hypothetical protein
MHVERVDPRHTSQTCSRCGYQARTNRRSQSTFHCPSCGYELNADLNAAYNIRDTYCLASRGTAVGSGTLVNRPFVSDLGLGTSLRPFRRVVVDHKKRGCIIRTPPSRSIHERFFQVDQSQCGTMYDPAPAQHHRYCQHLFCWPKNRTHVPPSTGIFFMTHSFQTDKSLCRANCPLPTSSPDPHRSLTIFWSSTSPDLYNFGYKTYSGDVRDRYCACKPAPAQRGYESLRGVCVIVVKWRR